jgi:hypothetical protein
MILLFDFLISYITRKAYMGLKQPHLFMYCDILDLYCSEKCIATYTEGLHSSLYF